MTLFSEKDIKLIQLCTLLWSDYDNKLKQKLKKFKEVVVGGKISMQQMAGEIESRTGLRFGRNEGICNNYDQYAKNSNEKSRQHARTDGESKQRDENS